jgi:hypothetical protein
MGMCFSRMGIEVCTLGMWILRDGLVQVEPRRSVHHALKRDQKEAGKETMKTIFLFGAHLCGIVVLRPNLVQLTIGDIYFFNFLMLHHLVFRIKW